MLPVSKPSGLVSISMWGHLILRKSEDVLIGRRTSLDCTTQYTVLRLSAVFRARWSLLPITLVINIAAIELGRIWPGIAKAAVSLSGPRLKHTGVGLSVTSHRCYVTLVIIKTFPDYAGSETRSLIVRGVDIIIDLRACFHIHGASYSGGDSLGVFKRSAGDGRG